MPPDDYTLREYDGVTLIRLETESLMGVLEVTRVTGEIDALLNGGVGKLILDFKHVRHFGSAALGMLMSLAKRMKASGGKLVLSHTENLDPLLRVSRSRQLFTIAAGPKEALEMMEGK